MFYSIIKQLITHMLEIILLIYFSTMTKVQNINNLLEKLFNQLVYDYSHTKSSSKNYLQINIIFIR